MNTIARVTGRLTLTIGDAPSVDLGAVIIPVEAATTLDKDGSLVLRATPNMWRVRELIEQLFATEGRAGDDASD